jgi:phytanoyl-CoA hydroxylase
MTQMEHSARPWSGLDFEQMARRFSEDGALFAGPVLTADELEEVRENLERYRTSVLPALPREVFEKTVRVEDDGESLRSCYFMDQIDPYFEAFGNRADFKELVGRVSGWEPELYVVETFNKYPQVGTAASPHQDCAFLPLEPMDVIHLWIAIDDATLENGALRYWLGSHRQGILPHVRAQWGKRVDPSYVDYESDAMIAMEVPAGAAAIHSGLVVHDSPPNESSKPRLGLLCGYRGAHTRYLREDAE